MTSTSFIASLRAFRNGDLMNGKFVVRADEAVTITFDIPTTNFQFLTPVLLAPCTIHSDSNETSWQLSKSCAQLYEKGENIYFRVVEKLGGGKLIFHVLGFSRIKREWHLEHTQEVVQFYLREDGQFFTPSFQDQTDIQVQLQWMIQADEGVPSIVEYVEIYPECWTVLSFNPFTHVGVIQTSLGLAMFHRKDVRRNSSTCVKPGTKVDYILLKQEGHSFPYKAVDVGYPHEEL